ncbi:MAG: FAD-dependent oxidoreductase, partial [Methylococcaceae bacterium]
AYTRVKISLLHEHSNFLFTPLLPEVIGGTVQPGNVVNPIRRIIPQVNVVIGRLESIDSDNRMIWARRPNGERFTLSYTELVVAQAAIPETTRLPGLLAHAIPIDSVGDALHIRKRLLDLVEEAEFTDDPEERIRLLNIAVLGSGEIACSVAAEICQMLKAIEHSYPVLKASGWSVRLYEDTDHDYSPLEQERMALRDECLTRAGITLQKGLSVIRLGAKELVLSDGSEQKVGLVINACFSFPALRIMGTPGLIWPFTTRSNMALEGFAHIFIAEPCRQESESHFITAADWRSFGEAAGYNAWAATQGYKTRVYTPRERIIRPFSIGFQSFCDLRAFAFRGGLAWLLSRLSNLLVMPGLEKNLRILIDWAMIIP